MFFPKDVSPNDSKSSMLNWTSELCHWCGNCVLLAPRQFLLHQNIQLFWQEDKEMTAYLPEAETHRRKKKNEIHSTRFSAVPRDTACSITRGLRTNCMVLVGC